MNRHLIRLATAAGTGLLLVLVGACGSPDATNAQPVAQTQSQSAQPTEPPESTESVPLSEPVKPIPSSPPAPMPVRGAPEGAKELPATQTDFSGLSKDFPRSLWVSADGRTIGALSREGGCEHSSAEVREAGTDTVVFTIVVTTPAKQRICTMDIRQKTVTAQLSTPLGDRTLIVRNERRKV